MNVKTESPLMSITPRPGAVMVRGAGLLWAVKLAEPVADSVRERAFDQGLLINAPRPDLLRLMPSLRVADGEIDEMASILDRCL